MNTITNIKAEQILDSRGNPTLRVSVFSGDKCGTFEVPSGASTGKYEACELRDGEGGKSTVLKAVSQIEEVIKPQLLGMNPFSQYEIDKLMIDLDGTLNKTNLGGNSMIGVSIALAKLGASIKGLEVYEYLRELKDIKRSREFPYLYFNLINGGKHAKSGPAFQEYHIVPNTDNLEESIEISRNIQKKLDEVIYQEFNQNFPKGDEGGITLLVNDVYKPLSLLKKVVDLLGYQDKVYFALDVASSSFFDLEKNVYNFNDKSWTTDEMIDFYKNLSKDYNIISIEDPLDEEDFSGFSKLQNELKEVKMIGDDLTVTNKARLERAIKEKSIKGIIIKPNQIGTLSETLDTMFLARENDIECIVSHRSGETMDNFIADLVFAFGCFGIKTGALGPKERDVKYERLINIINRLRSSFGESK